MFYGPKNHYENIPMHAIYRDFLSCKKKKKKKKKKKNYIFLIFAQNIDCGYTLESPSFSI